MEGKFRWLLPGKLRGPDRPVDLETWRIWFARALILMGALLFPLGSVFSIPQHITEGHNLLSVLNLAAWIVLLVRCFKKPDAYRGNALAILLLLYVLTISYFVTLGPTHARPAWLLACAVMSALMFGVRGAVVATLLNAAMLLVLYEVVGPENSAWSAEYQAPYYRWLLFIINATLLAIITSLPAGYMLLRLDRSLKYEREAQQRLAEEGRRLKETNAALAREVELRRETEKTLREKEEYLRILFDKAPDAYYLLGPHGKVVDINQAMEKILGYPKAEVVGKQFYETGCVPAEEVPMAMAHFERKIQGEGRVPVEGDFQRKDGGRVTLEMNTFPVVIKGEVHLLEIARDITQRKRAEAEKKQLQQRLMQAQKMEAIGTLAGGIAHDFNNILSGVLGYAELALSHIEDTESLRHQLDGVLASGNRARDLVRQILTFSRSEAEQEIVPVAVASVAGDVLKMMRATLPTTIEIRGDLESEAAVSADPVQLHQVLVNLCTNSGQAMMDRGGVLTVRVSDMAPDRVPRGEYPELGPGPHVEIVVADTGRGIPREVIGRIFDPYFTTKPPGEGTGLGLSIVHGIIRNSGGVLSVQSDPDRETTFRILLPVVETGPEAEERSACCFPEGTERILLVDDEVVIMEIGQMMLERLGYRVTAKTSSVEALSLFEENPGAYDLVITDMTMPVLTGKALAERMMAIRPDIPIILCTGFSHLINKEQALEMGIRAFVLKPFNLEKIGRAVREVLDGPGCMN